MQKNGDETKTQKPKKHFWRDYDSIEKFNLIIAVFALLSSIATIGLYFIARDTLKVGQRAYLIFHNAKLIKPLAINETPSATVELINSGLTPALNTQYSFIVFVGNSPNSPEIFINLGAIGAGRENTLVNRNLHVLTEEQYRQVTAEEVSYENGKLKITNGPHVYAVGHAIYYDVFGKRGDTYMCGVFFNSLKESTDGLRLASCERRKDDLTWEK